MNYLTAFGGAVSYCTLNNCTVVGNSTTFNWASVVSGALNNCIVYYNNGANYDGGSILNYTCTLPLPANGVGNITNSPLFVDLAKGDFHLQADSPCINSGLNLYVSGGLDLDGLPRIIGGSVDMGAYEYPLTVPSDFQAWLQSFGLATDGSADFADTDGDGLNNWQEWIFGTNPTNALSCLRILSVGSSSSTNVTVTWQSVAGVNYWIERGTNLAVSHPLAATNFVVLSTNIVGSANTTSFVDTNAAGASPLFYRVGVLKLN